MLLLYGVIWSKRQRPLPRVGKDSDVVYVLGDRNLRAQEFVHGFHIIVVIAVVHVLTVRVSRPVWKFTGTWVSVANVLFYDKKRVRTGFRNAYKLQDLNIKISAWLSNQIRTQG
jgi:hypothetical protein